MKIPNLKLSFSADVVSALNDPLCEGEGGSVSPPLSYSSSPVKSESAASKSSCEWSDLIEQDEKELQVSGCRSCRFIVIMMIPNQFCF